MNHEPTVRDRWLGAVCYLSILVIIPIAKKERSAFLARHCRIGFALVFCEVAIGLAVWVLESAFGRIPLLGLLIGLILHLGYWLVFLALSVAGFMKALSGETISVPVVDDIAARVPIHESHDENIY